MLLPRLLTALVGIPLLLALIHLGSLPFLAFVVGVAALALYEYALLLWIGGRGIQRVTAVLGGALVAAAVALGAPAGAFQGGLAGLAISAVVLVAMFREMLRPQHSFDRAALTVFGVFFVAWPLAHLALIRDLRPHGEAWTFTLFGAIWVMDTAAYAVGKTLGRHPMASEISPKKTWEGAAAGFAGAVAAVVAARHWLMPDACGPAKALAIGVMIGVVGQASDLAESVVKRAVGAKDSGALLPGHGGVLDRFDSFLLTAPMMYYMLILP